MKKSMLVLLLVSAVILAIYAYSYARSRVLFSHPEDMAGQESSAFLPERLDNGKSAAKGSNQLHVAGPVWVDQ